MKTKTVIDQMNAEPAEKVLSELEAKHGSAPATGSAECEHDWKEEYYGTRCSKCNTFYPTGSEPWAPTDDAVGELQQIQTHDDDLLDAGIVPLQDVPKCVVFKCSYAPLVWMKEGQSLQTQNGHFTIKIDGWYCPICGGGYGGSAPLNSV